MVASVFTPTSRCRWDVLLLSSAIFSVVSAGVVWADPGPREFYGKDYASAPQVAHAPLEGEELSNDKSLKQGAAATGRGAPDTRGFKGQSAANDADQKALAAMQAQGAMGQRKKRDKAPQTTLMLFVNSVDRQHIRSVLKKAIEVVKKDDAFLTSIYQIGDYRNVPPELAATLEQYGVVVAPMPATPDDFGLTQSPAWVFQSEEGFQIVEGTSDIEQFYDSQGNFKEPENFIASQTPREPSEGSK